MSQSHEKQLVEALRGILATGDDGTSLERDEKILKAIKEELAPLVELAATPHREYGGEGGGSVLQHSHSVASKEASPRSWSGLHQGRHQGLVCPQGS